MLCPYCSSRIAQGTLCPRCGMDAEDRLVALGSRLKAHSRKRRRRARWHVGAIAQPSGQGGLG